MEKKKMFFMGLVTMLICSSIGVQAQETIQKSKFTAGADLYSNYMRFNNNKKEAVSGRDSLLRRILCFSDHSGNIPDKSSYPYLIIDSVDFFHFL